MIFPESKQPQSLSPLPKPPQQHLLFHQAFTNLQTHVSNFLHHHQSFNFPLFNPDPLLKTHLNSTFSNLHNHVKNSITAIGSHLNSAKDPVWARIADKRDGSGSGSASLAMSTEAVEERLAGVPVYALSNSSQEFVLVSGVNSGKSLGLFCLKEEDAKALLEQMKSMDPEMRHGSKVVAVALNKVFQLKVDGVAFRLIPESTQIKNALKVRKQAGISDESFAGVPVFQSKSLILRSQNKRYRPVFFRKEDLENSLTRASRQQKQLNPALKAGDIQVAVLEEIIQGMKDDTTSQWDDVVFIPPGFDVSTDPSKH